MSKFGPKNFIEACREYSNHDGWEILNEIGTAQFMRKQIPGSELYEYKSLFTLENAQPTEYIDFSSDVDYLPKWNKHMKSVRKLAGGKYVYWETIMPMLMENRDYVFSFTRETVEYEHQTVHVIELVSHTGHVPEIDGIVRVTDFRQIVCAAIDDKCPTSTKVMSYLYIDLKMTVPKWFINFVAKVVYPKQHKDLLKHFKIYKTKDEKLK